MKKMLLVLAAVSAGMLLAAEDVAWPKGESALSLAKSRQVIAKSPEVTPGKTFSMKIKVTAQTAGPLWRTAGIRILRDTKNYCQIAFINSPKDMKMIELKQCVNGKWGASDGVPKGDFRTFTNWEENKEYTLTLTPGQDKVVAVTTDADGKEVSRVVMPVTDPEKAIVSGKPACYVANTTAEFSGAEVK